MYCQSISSLIQTAFRTYDNGDDDDDDDHDDRDDHDDISTVSGTPLRRPTLGCKAVKIPAEQSNAHYLARYL